MKILRINNQKGEYSLDGSNFLPVTGLTKEDLLKMINEFMDNDVEMDEFKEELLPNRAEGIIYRNLYTKFSSLLEHKESYKDLEDTMYQRALEKYQKE